MNYKYITQASAVYAQCDSWQCNIHKSQHKTTQKINQNKKNYRKSPNGDNKVLNPNKIG